MAKKYKNDKKISLTPLDKGIYELSHGNKIFSEIFYHTDINLKKVEKNVLGKDCAAIVYSDGKILLNKDFQLNASEWEYIIAHCVLHLAFGHFDAEKMPANCDKKIWNIACDIYIANFLSDIKIGTPPFDSIEIYNGKKSDEIKIYEFLMEQGKNLKNYHFGTAAIYQEDMKNLNNPVTYDVKKGEKNYFTEAFAMALAHSVTETVQEVSGRFREEDTLSKKDRHFFSNGIKFFYY